MFDSQLLLYSIRVTQTAQYHLCGFFYGSTSFSYVNLHLRIEINVHYCVLHLGGCLTYIKL